LHLQLNLGDFSGHLNRSLTRFKISNLSGKSLNSAVVHLDDTLKLGDLSLKSFNLELNDSLLTISGGLLELILKSDQGSVRVVELFHLGLELHLVNLKDHLLSLDSLVEGRFELLQFLLEGSDL
jgi:hypothetical protein